MAAAQKKQAVEERKKQQPDLVLYSYWRSSCSWRVRIALNLKGFAYDYEAVHLVKNIQFSDDYTSKQNPMGRVPTLMVDGTPLCESLAICNYLNDIRPEAFPLLPDDPLKKAQVLRLVETINTGVQPIQNLAVLRKVMGYFTEAEKKTEVKMEWGKHWIDSGFSSLEKMLEKTAGKYCFGDEITMADLFLVPQVYNANRFKVEMSKFPNIVRINNELETIAAFKSAHPDQQPDAQK